MDVAGAQRQVIVIGAGVAGLSSALLLLRRGFRVGVIDPLGPGGGASFGNAGMIGPEAVVPIALPGMLRNVPRWLGDPLGPLRLDPRHLPRALPWLLNWLEAGRLPRVRAISDVMRRLHRSAYADWKSLLGDDYGRHIRESGQIHLWDGPAETPTAAIERELRARHGVESRALSREELRGLAPGIDANRVGRAILVPGNGQTVNPGALMRRLGEIFVAEGGEIIAERALRLLPAGERPGALGAGRWIVMTNIANRAADSVVVAAGAVSDALLAPLGLRLPLERERGYHAMLDGVQTGLGPTILHKSRGFGMSAMCDGLRIAGTVEFTRRDAPPNVARAETLLRQAREIFPDLPPAPARFWMGSRPSFPDSLPVIGPAPARPGLWLVFGHSHFGMSSGPPSARLLVQQMLGEAPFLDPVHVSAERFRRWPAARAVAPEGAAATA